MPPATILPLFPLPDHVLLPGVPVSFRIYEPRYRAMVADLEELSEDDRWLAIPRLAEGWKTDYVGAPPFHAVAAAARLLRIQAMEHGQYMIVVEGGLRLRLAEISSSRPYRLARWAALPDLTPSSEAAMLAAEEVLAKVRVIARRLGDGTEQLAEMIAGEDHVVVADRLAAVLLGGADDRQRYLEDRDVAHRLADFARYLTIQLGPGADGKWNFSRN